MLAFYIRVQNHQIIRYSKFPKLHHQNKAELCIFFYFTGYKVQTDYIIHASSKILNCFTMYSPDRTLHLEILLPAKFLKSMQC